MGLSEDSVRLVTIRFKSLDRNICSACQLGHMSGKIILTTTQKIEESNLHRFSVLVFFEIIELPRDFPHHENPFPYRKSTPRNDSFFHMLLAILSRRILEEPTSVPRASTGYNTGPSASGIAPLAK